MRRRRTANPKPPPPPKAIRRAEWKARFARLLGLAFCVAGFAAIALGWAGAARKTCVDCQIPYLISGGAAGVALLILGGALLIIAQMRTEARKLSARLEQMTWTLADRFMAERTSGETSDTNAEGSGAPTVGAVDPGVSDGSRSVSAVDRPAEHVARASAEPGAPPIPWWER